MITQMQEWIKETIGMQGITPNIKAQGFYRQRQTAWLDVRRSMTLTSNRKSQVAIALKMHKIKRKIQS